MATESLAVADTSRGPARHGMDPLRRRGLSLYLRVVAVNAAVMLAAVAALALTPLTVSFPLAAEQGLVLALGLAAMVLADAALLGVTFRGLAALTQRMETLDVLQPQDRLPEVGGREAQAIIAGFNTMLDRLGAERRESTGRTLAAIEDERRRIGLELHDEIGQRLTGILLMLDRVHDEAPESLRGRVARVVEEQRAALDEVGALAWQLRPSVLDDLGLLSALGSLTGPFDEQHHFEITAELPSRLPPVAEDVQLVIYRIAQEAITNAVRHARATAIRLRLTVVPRGLSLLVSDDGCGYGGTSNERSGIRGMRERALLVGARLEITHQVAGGTRVHLEVPQHGLG